jgi:hypothetical protein
VPEFPVFRHQDICVKTSLELNAPDGATISELQTKWGCAQPCISFDGSINRDLVEVFQLQLGGFGTRKSIAGEASGGPIEIDIVSRF